MTRLPKDFPHAWPTRLEHMNKYHGSKRYMIVYAIGIGDSHIANNTDEYKKAMKKV